MPESHRPADEHAHQHATKLARQLRHQVQSGFREECWRDIDEAFYDIIRAGLDAYSVSRRFRQDTLFGHMGPGIYGKEN